MHVRTIQQILLQKIDDNALNNVEHLASRLVREHAGVENLPYVSIIIDAFLHADKQHPGSESFTNHMVQLLNIYKGLGDELVGVTELLKDIENEKEHRQFEASVYKKRRPSLLSRIFVEHFGGWRGLLFLVFCALVIFMMMHRIF